MKKILLVEDNKEISENIKEYLELEDYSVKACLDGECGLEESLHGNYDLILLDLMLPIVDGLSIARKLRERKNTPVIMITAKDSINDKLKGFDMGALDYIVKPFDLRELEARIKLIFNKSNTTLEIDDRFIKGDICIDIEKRSIRKAGEFIDMTQKEFFILEILVKNVDFPVTRTDIIEHVWGGGDAIFESDAKLDVYISTIRSKLGKELIKTIKGLGYRIDR